MDLGLAQKELGIVWLILLKRLVDFGEPVGDEFLELLNIYATFSKVDDDFVLNKFASMDNIREMRKVFFSLEENVFGHSYKENLVGPLGRDDFQDVVELLREKNSCKRALVTLVGNRKGKVPCVNAVHFLLRKEGLVINYFVRGQDVYNKFYADAIAISDMAAQVAKQLNVDVYRITALISSAHIYLNDLEQIQNILEEGKQYIQ